MRLCIMYRVKQCLQFLDTLIDSGTDRIFKYWVVGLDMYEICLRHTP